jgi:hypothetical protein
VKSMKLLKGDESSKSFGTSELDRRWFQLIVFS